MARNYPIMELIQHYKVADPDYASPIRRHGNGHEDGDLSMLPLYLRQDAVCTLQGKSQEIQLSPEERAELLKLWRLLDPSLDAVFSRYEADVAAGRTSLPVFAWAPLDGGPPLTQPEEKMRFAPSFYGAAFRRGYRNTTFLRSVSGSEGRIRHQAATLAKTEMGDSGWGYAR